MKICFIADASSIHTQVIADYFLRNGHTVHIISYRFKKEYYDSRIITHELRVILPKFGSIFFYLSFILWIFEVKKLVSEIKPDLVNGHYVTVFGFLASLTDFHPLIITAWGSDMLIQARHNPFWRRIARYSIGKADLFTCLFNVGLLQNDLGKSIPHGTRLESLPYGVNVDLFTRNYLNKTLRQSLGVEPEAPVIICTRGMEPVYDPETLVRAIPIIVDKFPNAHFLIYHQTSGKNPCEGLIKSLNIEKNVIILSWMPRIRVAEHLAISDIYVSTSLSDGASNALFEAMSCELAIVVTDIPANRYWIKDEENGFLFKVGDYNTLAEKIICLLQDKVKRDLFGRKCRKIILEKADQSNQMPKTLKIYQELLENVSNKVNIDWRT